jgi:hypothetical protein
MIFQVYDWGDDSDGDPLELYVSFHLNQDLGFFRRLWNGIKYIFGKRSKYGDFSQVSFKPQDVDRLLGALVQYKQMMAQYSPVPQQPTGKGKKVRLDHIPANYGIKFLYADVQPPFAVIFYAKNGEAQEFGLRLDIQKRAFIDRIEDQYLLSALTSNAGSILKAILNPKQEEKKDEPEPG